MKSDPSTFLRHILDSIALIEEYLYGVSASTFKAAPAIQDKVMYRLMIIGEAVKNLPESLKKEHDDIPWKAIAGMRDVLIHQYFGVDLDEVWLVLTKRLPVLKEKLQKILNRI